jgi:hypothetical protein
MNGSIPIFHNSLNIFLNHFCKLVCWKIRFYSAFLFLIIILVKAANVTFLNVYSLSKTCKKKFLFLTFILVAHVKDLSKKRKNLLSNKKFKFHVCGTYTFFNFNETFLESDWQKYTFYILCYFLFYVFLKELIRWIIFIQNFLTWWILL